MVRPRFIMSLLAVIGAAALATGLAIGAQGSGAPGAPPVRVLAVANPLRLITDAAGPSDIDSALPQRYRYAILGAPPAWSASALVRLEVRYLLAHGWMRAQATVLVNDGKSGTTRIRLVGIGTPGSSVQLDDPHHHIYAAIDMVPAGGTAADIGDGTPLPLAPIARALEHHDRLLNIVLGDGSHQRFYDGQVVEFGG